MIELCVLFKIKPGIVLDDCCDELIAQADIPLEENAEKRELIQLLGKYTDKSIHLLNLIAQNIYEDQEN